ncbi:hypothetical protein [Bifidobacterium choladohabitans]|uniref:hypothetical protein n=1 Tax=Bifidobacterium choladohabitans TaxID=2750947 RepID=UPI001E29CFE7|nr:hypothetical protein [Bifidobacterium choladohabitans]
MITYAIKVVAWRYAIDDDSVLVMALSGKDRSVTVKADWAEMRFGINGENGGTAQ